MTNLEQTVETSFLNKVKTSLNRVRQSTFNKIAVYSLVGVLGVGLGYGCGGDNPAGQKNDALEIYEIEVYQSNPKQDAFKNKALESDGTDSYQDNLKQDAFKNKASEAYETDSYQDDLKQDAFKNNTSETHGTDSYQDDLKQDTYPENTENGDVKSFSTCWDKTFGGSSYDWAGSILQTTNGKYIVAGMTDSKGAGLHDAWVFKLDANGNSEWDNTFGGNGNEEARSAHQTNDLGCVVAGETYSKLGTGWHNAWVFKLDTNGELEWDNAFGGSGYDTTSSILQTTDGKYTIAGWTDSKGAGYNDAWVFRLDSNGNLEWDNTYGGKYDDVANSILQINEVEYIVVGETSSKGMGEYDAWVFKLDSNGNLLWDNTFGGSDIDRAYSLLQTPDGGCVIAGVTSSKGAGGEDAWVFKLDSSGNLEWDNTFGGSDIDKAYSLLQTTDGGYIIAGVTSSKGAGDDDAWIFKLDSNGNLEWDNTFGGSYVDKAYSLLQTTDEGYIIAGVTSSKGAGYDDAWILKLDKNGNSECK